MAVNSEKQLVVSEIRERLAKTKGAVLADYRGLTVAQDTKLRRKLREAGVEYKVIKNTMLRIAARDAEIQGLDIYLEGPSALAISYDDPVAPAKIIAEFAKENKVMSIKAGILAGKVISADEVKTLASLPSKEVLVAKLLGSMQSPISGFVNVLQGTIRNVVYVLDAVRQQKESA